MFGHTRPDGTQEPAPMDLVRLAIPRRVYTQSHIDFVSEAVAYVYEKRGELGGYRIVDEPPTLRHFTCGFTPVVSSAGDFGVLAGEIPPVQGDAGDNNRRTHIARTGVPFSICWPKIGGSGTIRGGHSARPTQHRAGVLGIEITGTMRNVSRCVPVPMKKDHEEREERQNESCGALEDDAIFTK
jgi:hypothetical protein